MVRAMTFASIAEQQHQSELRSGQSLKIAPTSQTRRNLTKMSTLYELDEPPTDFISSVQFSPSGSFLLVGCWDRTISVYQRDATASKPFTLLYRILCRASVLDVAWGKTVLESYFVGLDYEVRHLDWDAGKQTVLSKHEKVSNKVRYKLSTPQARTQLRQA